MGSEGKFAEVFGRLRAKGYSDEEAYDLMHAALKGPSRAYIAPDIFLRLLCGASRDAEVALLEKKDVELVSDLFAFYEAIACIEPQDPFDRAALIRIFRKVRFTAEPELAPLYVPLKPERKKHLRETALGGYHEPQS